MIILGQLEAQLQHLYDERALLLALLTKHYPYTIHVDQTILDSPNRFVLFLDLPSGQVSFHIHEKNIDEQYFPQYKAPLTAPSPWDGHSVQEKILRLKREVKA